MFRINNVTFVKKLNKYFTKDRSLNNDKTSYTLQFELDRGVVWE